MKKLFIVSAIIVFFTSCSFSETFKDDPEFNAMMGILTSQKANDEYPGTHLLTDEQGGKTAVRSLSINLDSREYLGNKIEVLGVLNPEDKVFEVTGVSVLEVLAQVTLERELKDYENTELGFSLKYYSDWFVEEKATEVNFLAAVEEGANDRTFVKVSQEQYLYTPITKDDGSTDTPLMAYFLEKENKDVNSLINKLGTDSLEAVKIEKEKGVIEYILYRPGLIYKINFTPAEKVGAEDKNIFMEMLNSFRFIGFEPEGTGLEEIAERPDRVEGETLVELDLELTTFESLPYAFKGKYPKTWYYAGKRGNDQEVLHHYGFSEDSVTDENELISLDVVGKNPLFGKRKLINEKEIYIEELEDQYIVYVTVEGQNYKLVGNSQYKDLIEVMAVNIEVVKKEENTE